jgi:hypothetical protein
MSSKTADGQAQKHGCRNQELSWWKPPTSSVAHGEAVRLFAFLNSAL